MINFSHISRNDEGDVMARFCMDCNGQIFGCPDPACEGEVHHVEPMIDPKCPFSIKTERSTARPLTRPELIAYVDHWRKIADELRTKLYSQSPR